MKHVAFLVVFCMAALCATAGEQSAPLMLSQTIDFFDNCWFTRDNDHYPLEALRARVKLAHDHGFRKIYFRGTGGCSYYNSKVRHAFQGEARPQADNLARTIRKYDTVGEYIKICHELGMELYYWDPIFDNDPFFRLYPGMEGYDRLKDVSMTDTILKPADYMAHRKAYLPRENLARPIATLRIRAYGNDIPADIGDKDILVYTAPHDKPFVRYAKPFKVAQEKAEGGCILVLSGLEIADPVIKFASDTFVASTDSWASDGVRAFYADGEEVKLYRSVENYVFPDKDREYTLWGVSGTSRTWGKGGRSLIARFGDFQRYALGVPEYANPACRKRLVDIVTELYELYPDLDGVSFSIRTHSLPATGFKEEMGFGDKFYGFSEPIVRDYKAKYGIDPRKEPYDVKAWLKIRGKYITQMLDEVAAVVHKHGGKLQMMAPVDVNVLKGTTKAVTCSLGSMYPWWNGTGIDDLFDISTWAKRGSVDLVLMLGTGYRQTKWNQAWKDEVKRFKDRLAGTKTKLGLHYLINEARADEVETFLPQLLAQEELDELAFYEEANMYLEKSYGPVKKALDTAKRNIYGK